MTDEKKFWCDIFLATYTARLQLTRANWIETYDKDDITDILGFCDRAADQATELYKKSIID